VTSRCNDIQMRQIVDYQHAFYRTLNSSAAFGKSIHGSWISSCHTHCGGKKPKIHDPHRLPSFNLVDW
jgi:hypothetical protein